MSKLHYHFPEQRYQCCPGLITKRGLLLGVPLCGGGGGLTFRHCALFRVLCLYRCAAVPQGEFRRLSGTRVGGRSMPLAAKSARLRQRHAGVLGLCACVEAFPYDVPLFIPDVLMTLSRHLNDPQPIQVRGVAGWHSRVLQVRRVAFTGRTGTHGDIGLQVCRTICTGNTGT